MHIQMPGHCVPSCPTTIPGAYSLNRYFICETYLYNNFGLGCPNCHPSADADLQKCINGTQNGHQQAEPNRDDLIGWSPGHTTGS
ncbi:hypothetical protein XENTR_v10022624 [Xenopus tropicalis]|nr:hypothetical protein XENTR_v10022624 [Xenopus tropicalis]